MYASDRGFAVGRSFQVDTGVEDREAPGRGSLPNLIQNSSFESGARIPTGWLFTPGVSLVRAGDTGAAFGASIGNTRIPRGGAVYQLVVADLPMNTEYVAGVWMRSPSDASVTAEVYVVALAENGRRIDPLAASMVTVPGDGGWHHALLHLRTPGEHITYLQVMVRSPEREIGVDLDGASLTEGPVVRESGWLVEGHPAASTGSAVLRESPLLGLGPQKDARGAVYDNEYVAYLLHYGLLGLSSYLFLFIAAAAEGFLLLRRDRGRAGLFGVILVTTTFGLWAFAISAGSYRQLQVMLPYWLLAGLVVASLASARPAVVSDPSRRT